MIIGITGTLAAGKSTVANILVEKGFKHYSVRKFLIEEIKRKGLEINRDNMILIGNELRGRYSPSYIAEQLYSVAKIKGGNSVIESLRNPSEVEALREKGEFYLIAVDADPKVRYERSDIRNEETDGKEISFEEFLSGEQREMESPDPTKQNIKKCVEMADFVIDNEGSTEELIDKIGGILGKIKSHVRPSWDEYFMNLAEVTGTRGTCNRGRTGCVIVKDKHILVGGYAGSPKGLPHCDEVGHLMKTVIHEDGSESRHCLRTAHAEQNAICQAAKIGISIEGSTIYAKMTPCAACAKMIINVGIKRIVCKKRYHADSESEELFKQAGVVFEILENVLEKYEDQ